MRKILTGWTMVGLGVALVMGAGGCAKQAGPLSPQAPLMSAETSGNRMLPYLSTGNWFTNVSDTAEVIFSLPMDPTSFNAGTVLLYTLDASGVTETLYTNYTMVYLAGAQTLRFTPGGGAWATNVRYHAVFTTGIRSINGRPLDGNANGIPESDEFDAVHLTTVLGSPAATPNYTNTASGVRISSAALAYNGVSQAVTLTSPNYLSINGTYTYVTLTAYFAVTGASDDPNFSMDTSTFFTSATALHPNVSFTDASGQPITPVLVSVTSTALTNDTLTIVASLAPASKYSFKLKGGLNGIRSSSATNVWLRRGYTLNGNGVSSMEASDDTPVTVIQTRNDTNNPLTSVRITSDAYDSTNRRFILTFTVVGGIGALDPTTINATNFMLSDSGYSGYACTPSVVEVDNASAPNPVVYVYVPQRFIDYGTGDAHTLYVMVRKDVKSSDGVMLDQNNDGVPGTSADNYSSTGASIFNY